MEPTRMTAEEKIEQIKNLLLQKKVVTYINLDNQDVVIMAERTYGYLIEILTNN